MAAGDVAWTLGVTAVLLVAVGSGGGAEGGWETACRAAATAMMAAGYRRWHAAEVADEREPPPAAGVTRSAAPKMVSPEAWRRALRERAGAVVLVHDPGAPEAPPPAGGGVPHARGAGHEVFLASTPTEARVREWPEAARRVASRTKGTGARRVVLDAVRLMVPLTLLFLTAAAWAPMETVIWVDAAAAWPGRAPVPPPPEAAPVVPKEQAFSLRVCDAAQGECNRCAWADWWYAASGVGRGRRQVHKVMRYAEALADDPHWRPHQADEEAVGEARLCDEALPPSLAAALRTAARFAAQAPAPPVARLPDDPVREHDAVGRVRLPWLTEERPEGIVKTTVPTDQQVALWWELARGVASRHLLRVEEGWLRCAHLWFGVQQGGKVRVCTEMAQVSAFLDSSFRVEYGTPEMMLADGAVAGGKADAKTAFKTLEVEAEAWPYLGFVIDGVAVVAVRVQFGITHGPALWVRRLERVMAAVVAATSLVRWVVYMDDVGWAAGSAELAAIAALTLAVWWPLHGVWLAVAKFEWRPARKLKFLGLMVDWTKAVLRVPTSTAAKLAGLAAELGARAATADPGRELREMARRFGGKLAFLTRALPILGLMARAIYKATPDGSRWTARAAEEAEALGQLLPRLAKLYPAREIGLPLLLVCFDASSPTTGGAWWAKVGRGWRVLSVKSYMLREHGFDAAALQASTQFEGATCNTAMREADGAPGGKWDSALAVGDPMSLCSAATRQRPDEAAGPRWRARSAGLAAVLLDTAEATRDGKRLRFFRMGWQRRSEAGAQLADATSAAVADTMTAGAALRAAMLQVSQGFGIDLAGPSAEAALADAWCYAGGDAARGSLLARLLEAVQGAMSSEWPAAPGTAELGRFTSAVVILGPAVTAMQWLGWLRGALAAAPGCVLWVAGPVGSRTWWERTATTCVGRRVAEAIVFDMGEGAHPLIRPDGGSTECRWMMMMAFATPGQARPPPQPARGSRGWRAGWWGVSGVRTLVRWDERDEAGAGVRRVQLPQDVWHDSTAIVAATGRAMRSVHQRVPGDSRARAPPAAPAPTSIQVPAAGAGEGLVPRDLVELRPASARAADEAAAAEAAAAETAMDAEVEALLRTTWGARRSERRARVAAGGGGQRKGAPGEGTGTAEARGPTVVVGLRQESLLDVDADAIVSAAGATLPDPPMGVALVIAQAGGAAYAAGVEALRRAGGLPPGTAVATAPGEIPGARCVVQAVGADSRVPAQRERAYDITRAAVRRALACADAEGARHVAIPALAAGLFRTPPEVAAAAAVAGFTEWMTLDAPRWVRRVTWAVPARDLLPHYRAALAGAGLLDAAPGGSVARMDGRGAVPTARPTAPPVAREATAEAADDDGEESVDGAVSMMEEETAEFAAAATLTGVRLLSREGVAVRIPPRGGYVSADGGFTPWPVCAAILAAAAEEETSGASSSEGASSWTTESGSEEDSSFVSDDGSAGGAQSESSGSDDPGARLRRRREEQGARARKRAPTRERSPEWARRQRELGKANAAAWAARLEASPPSDSSGGSTVGTSRCSSPSTSPGTTPPRRGRPTARAAQGAGAAAASRDLRGMWRARGGGGDSAARAHASAEGAAAGAQAQAEVLELSDDASPDPRTPTAATAGARASRADRPSAAAVRRPSREESAEARARAAVERRVRARGARARAAWGPCPREGPALRVWTPPEAVTVAAVECTVATAWAMSGEEDGIADGARADAATRFVRGGRCRGDGPGLGNVTGVKRQRTVARPARLPSIPLAGSPSPAPRVPLAAAIAEVAAAEAAGRAAAGTAAAEAVLMVGRSPPRIFAPAESRSRGRAWARMPCRGTCNTTIAGHAPARFCDVVGCDDWACCRRCAPEATDDRRLLCPGHQLHRKAVDDKLMDAADHALRESQPGTIGRVVARLWARCEGKKAEDLEAWPLEEGRGDGAEDDGAKLFARAAGVVLDEIWTPARRKKVGGSARRLTTFARHCGAWARPTKELEAFALLYARRRIRDPLDGWQHPNAKTVRAEMSTLAEAVRADGGRADSHMGATVRRYLALSGGFEREGHTRSWPVSVRELWEKRAECPEVHKPALYTGLFQGVACLRAGARFRWKEIRPCGDGWGLRWERATKVRRGDRLVQPGARPAVEVRPQFSVVAGPVVDACLAYAKQRWPRAGPEDPIFPVTAAAVTAMLRALLPLPPAAFRMTAHSIRAGSASVLQAMRVPRDVVQVMGWWARERLSDGYYASASVDVMIAATSLMHTVQLLPEEPGFARARLHAPLPVWAEVAAKAVVDGRRVEPPRGPVVPPDDVSSSDDEDPDDPEGVCRVVEHADAGAHERRARLK